MSGELRVKRLDQAARLPARAHDDDAGYDLHALEAARLEPGARAKVRTGIAIELSCGHAALVLPRSGLAARHGLSIVNAPGTVDAGYRGEISVLLVNTDRHTPVQLSRGDRIAQLVVQRVERGRFREVDRLPESSRGAGGYGSTGGFPAAATSVGAPAPVRTREEEH